MYRADLSLTEPSVVAAALRTYQCPFAAFGDIDATRSNVRFRTIFRHQRVACLCREVDPFQTSLSSLGGDARIRSSGSTTIGKRKRRCRQAKKPRTKRYRSLARFYRRWPRTLVYRMTKSGGLFFLSEIE